MANEHVLFVETLKHLNPDKVELNSMQIYDLIRVLVAYDQAKAAGIFPALDLVNA